MVFCSTCEQDVLSMAGMVCVAVACDALQIDTVLYILFSFAKRM